MVSHGLGPMMCLRSSPFSLRIKMVIDVCFNHVHALNGFSTRHSAAPAPAARTQVRHCRVLGHRSLMDRDRSLSAGQQRRRRRVGNLRNLCTADAFESIQRSHNQTESALDRPCKGHSVEFADAIALCWKKSPARYPARGLSRLQTGSEPSKSRYRSASLG